MKAKRVSIETKVMRCWCGSNVNEQSVHLSQCQGYSTTTAQWQGRLTFEQCLGFIGMTFAKLANCH